MAVERPQGGGRGPGYYALAAAATRFGVPVEEAHHALDDAFMTAELFLVAANALEARGSGSIRDLLPITPPGEVQQPSGIPARGRGTLPFKPRRKGPCQGHRK